MKTNITLRLFRWTLAVCLLAGLAVWPALAAPKEIKPSHQWTGSLTGAGDDKLAKLAPEVITDAKTLEKVWTAWRIKGKLPEVDFTKEFVMVSTSPGSVLRFNAMLDDKGNLANVGIATMDFGPGFRYVIATISREGVKTVNRKPLP